MSDSFVNPIFGDREGPATQFEAAAAAEVQIEVEVEDAGPAVQGTGHADVDAVIDSLGGLDDLPVEQHVAVFEQAHESLRRTLVGAGQDGRNDAWASDRS